MSDIRYKYNSDMDFCIQLFTALVTGCAKDDIKRMIRLGQKQNSGRERLLALLIEFHDRTVKNIVMDSPNKLWMLEEKFRKVVVVHDRTPKERQECKEMVEEATAGESGGSQETQMDTRRPKDRRRTKDTPGETAGESGGPQEMQMGTMDARRPKGPQEN